MKFSPDLIIEVTSACNRSCSGCYAPNVTTSQSAEELMRNQPNLFLSLDALDSLISFWDQSLPEVVSIRGGEPSLHPELFAILKNLRFFSKERVLETHGRWLLKDERKNYETLISSLVEFNVTVKISFDSMHRLQPIQLQEITSFLDSLGVKYLVAITEPNEEEFRKTLTLIPWVNEQQVIFQLKATSSDALIKPLFGVVNVAGFLSGSLNSKFKDGLELRNVVG